MRAVTPLLVTALSLAACQAATHVAGTRQGGVVNPALSTEAQLAAANMHCARFGKRAVLRYPLETGSVLFDCIF